MAAVVTGVQDNCIATGNARKGRVEKVWGGGERVDKAVFVGVKNGKKYGAAVARPEMRQETSSREVK